MRRITFALLAVLLSATSCSSGEDAASSDDEPVDTPIVSEESASVVCSAWDDISSMLTRIDEEEATPELVDGLIDAMGEVESAVPAMISNDWDAIGAFLLPFRELLVTVEYDLDLATPELIAQAFGGEGAAETLEGASDAGEASIGRWAVTACGDFCTRWTETREAFEQTGFDLGWVIDMGSEGPDQLDEMFHRIDVAGELVPDELAPLWNRLMAPHRDLVGWWERYDFRREDVESEPAQQAALEIVRDADYFDDVAFDTWGGPPEDREAFLADVRSNPDGMYDMWRHQVPEWIGIQLESIDVWVDTNCDSVRGAPGRVQVVYPEVVGAAGTTLAFSLMPRGSRVEDIVDSASLAASYCEQVSRDPWGYEFDGEGRRNRWNSDWFRAERGDGLCEIHWEEGPARVDAGEYTLLAVLGAGLAEGNLMAEQIACLALDVVVDGDTVVELPELPPCVSDLPELTVDRSAWRTPAPVDPSVGGAGTLQLVVPNLTTGPDDDAVHGGELLVVVLPADTTLNDVGREEVWPSGGARVWLVPGGSEHARELERFGPVNVPVMQMPASGSLGPLDPNWLAEGPPAERLPLTLLAPGAYDVYLHVQVHSEDEDLRDASRCAHFEVTVDGDTVADVPELGECA